MNNLDDLQAACRRLGLDLVRGHTSYRWYGKRVNKEDPLPQGFTDADLGKCDHMIRIPGDAVQDGFEDDEPPYQIGVVRRRDGRPGYTLMWDFWEEGFGMERFVGENCNKLKQAYALAAAKRTAMAKGFSVSEQARADGSIQLVCRK